MIDLALACLAKELDAWMQAKADTGPGQVVLDRLVDDNGLWAIPDDSVGMMLINVQIDRAAKAPPAAGPLELGGAAASGPALNLDLSVLLAAQSREYPAALSHLSHALAFFNAHPVFTRERYPALGPRIEAVEVALEPVDYEQIARIWSFVGGRQVPSVLYRVRVNGS